ncbi:MAG: hypothetical protein IJW55_03760 [Clostridia bacterium]|nr:hypothetical protein [Clostridia bacterium]
MKRMILIFLALLLTFSTMLGMVSCNKDDENTPVDTSDNGGDEVKGEYDEDGFLNDDLPDLDYNLANISMLVWEDVTMQEFEAEGLNGQAINDAIYYRNLEAEARLNVEFSYTEKAGHAVEDWFNTCEIDYSSGSKAYHIYATYSRTFATLATRGFLVDLKQTTYLDLEKPWWPEGLRDNCTINNKLYFASGDISSNALWMMHCIFVNEDAADSWRVFEEKQLYDIINDGEWTLDLMLSMCKDVFENRDGDDAVTSGDFFAFTAQAVNLNLFSTGSGLLCMAKDEDDALIISDSLASEKMISVINKTRQIAYADNAYVQDGIDGRKVFCAQNALFHVDKLFVLRGKDNQNADQTAISFDVLIAPSPKYSESQKEYYTAVGAPFTMYGINNLLDASTVDMLSAALECLASESYRQVTPIIFEESLKLRYSKDDVTSKMFDTIRNGVVYDIGEIFDISLSYIPSTIFVNQVKQGSTTIASDWVGQKPVVEKLIGKIMEKFQ